MWSKCYDVHIHICVYIYLYIFINIQIHLLLQDDSKLSFSFQGSRESNAQNSTRKLTFSSLPRSKILPWVRNTEVTWIKSTNHCSRPTSMASMLSRQPLNSQEQQRQAQQAVFKQYQYKTQITDFATPPDFISALLEPNVLIIGWDKCITVRKIKAQQYLWEGKLFLQLSTAISFNRKSARGHVLSFISCRKIIYT